MPGTQVTETEIANELGVSRVVVREAFIALTQEGLLTKERNKFTKVVSFSKKDIKDIFDLRIAIEVAAASACIENNIDFISSLKEKSAIIDGMKKESTTNIEDMVRRDLELHGFIITSAANQRIIDVWNGLYSQY